MSKGVLFPELQDINQKTTIQNVIIKKEVSLQDVINKAYLDGFTDNEVYNIGYTWSLQNGKKPISKDSFRIYKKRFYDKVKKVVNLEVVNHMKSSRESLINVSVANKVSDSIANEVLSDTEYKNKVKELEKQAFLKATKDFVSTNFEKEEVLAMNFYKTQELKIKKDELGIKALSVITSNEK